MSSRQRLVTVLAAFITIGALLYFKPTPNLATLEAEYNQRKRPLIDIPADADAPSSIGKAGRDESVGEDINARFEWELMRLRDPNTGDIPRGIRWKEQQFARTIETAEQALAKANRGDMRLAGIQTLNWISRGPFNVGGRTRALALDISDPTEQTILAGGVSGGMWRSTDGGRTWTRTTRLDQLPSTTCIAQDTRVGKQNIWYVGTGEGIGNSAGAKGSGYRGDGIYKSTDGGRTWTLLASTSTARPQSFDNLFDFVWNIVTDPTNAAEDEVYAAVANGIFRSTDGGASWTPTLGGALANPVSLATDVAITSTGGLYATINSGGPFRGIYRSADGITWQNMTPSDFPNLYGRIVIGIAPSNENIVYFLAQTPNNGFRSNGGEFTSLWRYTRDPARTDSIGGTWENLSDKIPAYGGQAGDFNPQGGYNLIVKVAPDNPNTVFLGGTNIYRSNDALATRLDTTTDPRKNNWIGGYTRLGNSFALYLNQHPDQHAITFYRNPARSRWMLSANDGGVYRTENYLDTAVTWTSLENGYQTTQFYTIAIDEATAGSGFILGGMQDNGTWLNQRPVSETQNWDLFFGGDGSYCAIAPRANLWFLSSQNGNTLRLTRNPSNPNQLVGALITPVGASGFLFINPFASDPRDTNTIYMAAGDSLWRNNQIATVPASAARTQGWAAFQVPSLTSSNAVITALGVSRNAPRHRLYFGSNNGRVFRIDNANTTTTPTIVDISTGKGLPTGYVSNIAVDPLDANKALLIFSNYNIQSIFYTTDAGNTWQAVSGNLEETPTGTGNGPSIRWAVMAPRTGGYQYFVGTSTGVYSTTLLDSMRTVWVQEGTSVIGNVVVDMLAYRASDGFIVAATHGNGVFSATVPNGVSSAQNDQPTPYTFELSQNYPNPFNPTTVITYQIPTSSAVVLKVYDVLGREITTLVNQRQPAGRYSFNFNAAGLASGTYFYRLQAGDYVESRKMMLVK
ncbi:MAG: hypothetical protein HY22_06660 [[Candidatus Thermochlorobacteriaceae] bacterium GBChlB]|nr:MAG: hypothetical protein HY22_06660 [[Candidatus Thermochlorobacteriaceae] bacterium GBChlB]